MLVTKNLTNIYTVICFDPPPKKENNEAHSHILSQNYNSYNNICHSISK